MYATIALNGAMCYICSSEIGPCSQIGIFSATREVKSQCSNNKKVLFDMEFLRLAKLLALSLVCCLSMAACSKDSDDSGAKEPEDPDPYYMLEKLDASFSVIANEDVAEIADVSCVVTDFKGESKSYKLNKNNHIEVNLSAKQPTDPDKYTSSMTRAPWINLPTTAKIEVNMSLKQGFTPDPERTYDLSLRVDGVMVACNSFGNEFGHETSLNTFEKSFPAGEGIGEWMDEVMPCSFGFQCEFVNKTFKVTKTK